MIQEIRDGIEPPIDKKTQSELLITGTPIPATDDYPRCILLIEHATNVGIVVNWEHAFDSLSDVCEYHLLTQTGIRPICKFDIMVESKAFAIRWHQGEDLDSNYKKVMQWFKKHKDHPFTIKPEDIATKMGVFHT